MTLLRLAIVVWAIGAVLAGVLLLQLVRRDTQRRQGALAQSFQSVIAREQRAHVFEGRVLRRQPVGRSVGQTVGASPVVVRAFKRSVRRR